jgi:D-tyrosyl-tRNA(Tyr) deacylase
MEVGCRRTLEPNERPVAPAGRRSLTPPDDVIFARVARVALHSRIVRLLVQRASRAQVRIRESDGSSRVSGSIDRGFVLLVGFTHTDTLEQVKWMGDKVLGLRLFSDADDKMNLALADVAGSILVVSQFTLYGDAAKGRRPSFIDAARPEVAIPLYEQFIDVLRQSGTRVATGEFAASMDVELVNDGPVTLWLER